MSLLHIASGLIVVVAIASTLSAAELADAIAEIEGPSWLAAAHCEEMQEIALHLAGKAKNAEELTDAVNQAAAAWDKRLDDMAAACAGG